MAATLSSSRWSAVRDVARPVRRVLVVDDNEEAAELLSEHLRGVGVEARAAHDARGAWTIAESMHPDLVLLDIELPDEAGDALALRLREAGLARSIVAVTGHRGSRARELVERGGFDAYLPKPCSLLDIDAFIGVGVDDDDGAKDDFDRDSLS